jgi:iron complex transport system substrate-binding protein
MLVGGAIRSRLLLVAVLLGAVIGLVACDDDGGASAASPTSEASAADATSEATATETATATEAVGPLVVTDSDGFALEFETAPQRIVSYSPGVTEILFAIGAGAQVIAADEFSDYPAETAGLEKVSYSEPDPERVLGLDPDLVIMATRQQEQVEQFRGLGLVVMFNREPDSIEGVLENIRTLGKVTGHDAEAEALIASMEARIAAVEAAIADVEAGPRVFYELSEDLFTVAPETFVGSTLTLLKASNVAAGAETAFPQLTQEALIAANPEVVLLADAEFGASPEAVAARPGWDAVDAVINGRLYPVDPDLGNRPGPRIVDALEEVARLLYPDRFE